MVTKSSEFRLMHIFRRRSSLKDTSPRAGVTDDFAVFRLKEHRAFPEGLGQRIEPHRREERFAGADHAELVPGLQGGCVVDRRLVRERRDQRVDVVPALSPHVSGQVCRDGPRRIHDVRAVLLGQFGANVAVELLIQRLDLAPQAVRFGLDLSRRHVIPAAPQLAGVREPQPAGPLVGELDEPRIFGSHRRRDGVPSDPRVQLGLRVPVGGEDLLELAEVAALAVHARLTLAVHARQIGREVGQLGAFGVVVRGGQRGGDAEQVQGPRGVGIEPVDASVGARLADQPSQRRHRTLRRSGRGGLVLVGQVGLVRPQGLLLGHPGLLKLVVGRGHERGGVGGGGRSVVPLGAGGEQRDDREETALTHGVLRAGRARYPRDRTPTRSPGRGRGDRQGRVHLAAAPHSVVAARTSHGMSRRACAAPCGGGRRSASW
jgi:hypothetical protein